MGYHQTNRKTDTGKTLTRWPVLVDHYNSASFTFVPKPIDTHNYGVELEGSYQLADSWTLSGGLGYTHA
ncbi:hypothetical protein, partial [Serratia symbiotica]|uniref:hypothetical protein n=1 Tax=Serratia symbiotica TaxID=138074 RepID=UPI003464CAC8